MRELGEIGKQFGLGHTPGKMTQHFTHGEPCAPHTGFAESNRWIDADAFK